MNRYGKMFLAVMTVSLFLFLIERVLPVHLPLEHMLILFLFYLYGNWQIVYFTTPKASLRKKTEKKKEYIVQGNGQLSAVPFDKQKYRDYQRLSSDENGSTYSSPTGALVCTSYVSIRPNGKAGESSLTLILFCIFWALAAAFLYRLIMDWISGGIPLNTYWSVIQKNAFGREWRDYWEVIKSNMEAFRLSGLMIFQKLVAAVQNII